MAKKGMPGGARLRYPASEKRFESSTLKHEAGATTINRDILPFKEVNARDESLTRYPGGLYLIH
jgi:hypothetical protein